MEDLRKLHLGLPDVDVWHWICTVETFAMASKYRKVLLDSNGTIKELLEPENSSLSAEEKELLRSDTELVMKLESKMEDSMIAEVHEVLGHEFTACMLFGWIKETLRVQQFDFSGDIITMSMNLTESANEFYERMTKLARATPNTWNKKQFMTVFLTKMGQRYTNHVLWNSQIYGIRNRINRNTASPEDYIEIRRILTQIDQESSEEPDSRREQVNLANARGTSVPEKSNNCTRTECNGQPIHDYRKCPNVVCHKCQSKGHYANRCRARFADKTDNKEKKNVSFAYSVYLHDENNNKKNQENWILDSGASAHFISEKKLFSELDEKSSIAIQLADDSLIYSKGHGTAKLTVGNNDLILKNAHYVPGLKKNLVSVRKLAQENAVLFKQNEVYLIHQNNHQIHIGSTRDNNLYYMNLALEVDFKTCHRRLGHRSYHTISKTLEICGIKSHK